MSDIAAISLSRGYIADKRIALYLATSPVVIVDIVGRNDDNVARTFNIYRNTNGSRVGLTPKNISLGAGFSFDKILFKPVELIAGDSIEGDAETNNSINYEVLGYKL